MATKIFFILLGLVFAMTIITNVNVKADDQTYDQSKDPRIPKKEISDKDNKTEDSNKTETQKIETTTKAPAHEVPKLPENLPKPQPMVICSACGCNNNTHVLDCSNQNLENHFLDEDWAALNGSGFKFLTVNFTKNRLVHLLPFPEIEIQILDLSHNEILKIEPSTFKYLQEMTTLDLSYNKLVSEFLRPEVFEGLYAPETYEPLRSMKTLILSGNLLHTLHPDIFEHMAVLTDLRLDGNPLKVIDRNTEIAITSLPYLEHLDLSYTDIRVLPETMLHPTRNLKSLDLKGNLFTALPDGLESAKSLKLLILDENPITSIAGHDKFPTMEALTELHMCYMGELTTIGEGGLSGLRNLTKLYITNSPSLSYIHPSALSTPEREIDEQAEGEIWPPLEMLYLHNNNLSYLDSHLVARWDLLKVIDLRFNPWSCDCQNQWLVQSLIPIIYNATSTLVHGLVCHEPFEMKGKVMYDIEEQHYKMRCLDKYGNRPENDGAMLIGVLIGVLVAFPVMFALVLIYRRGCFGLLGRSRGPADFSRAFYKRADMNDDNMHI